MSEVQFTCEICSKSFDPTPDAMIEWEIGSEIVPAEQAESVGIPADELASMPDYNLKAVELTPEQRDALLRGEVVRKGGCICIECQDEMLVDQSSEEAFGEW